MNRHRIKGIGLVELFVAMGIFSLLMTITVPGLKSFMTRARVSSGLCTVTSSFHSARFQAVLKNKRVKVHLENNKILLMEKINRRWKTFKTVNLEKYVKISMNRSPVFSPFGTVAPLCTTIVEYKPYRYKVTISMAGRIKITSL